jgi:two-component system KDP operon response regulator KdpE
MTVQRVLIVDDESQIVRVLKPSIAAAGYDVAAAMSGGEALQMLAAEAFDVVVLDLGLPDFDGKEVITRLRTWSETPVIVLSARNDEGEKVEALDLGANDFVNKPFGIDELLARLRSTLRNRPSRPSIADRLAVAHLEIDFGRRGVRVAGQEVRPSPKEMALLRALLARRGEVLTHSQIGAAVWGADAAVEAQFVRVLVGNLRQKIELDPARPTLVLTEPGVGYRFADEPDGADRAET